MLFLLPSRLAARLPPSLKLPSSTARVATLYTLSPQTRRTFLTTSRFSIPAPRTVNGATKKTVTNSKTKNGTISNNSGKGKPKAGAISTQKKGVPLTKAAPKQSVVKKPAKKAATPKSESPYSLLTPRCF